MGNMETAETFDEGAHSYRQAGLLVDFLPTNGKKKAATQADICAVTEEFLAVCNIGCRFEAHPRYIYCFLTFEQYNMRVLADALKQQLVNLLGNLPVNIYYSDYLDGEEAVRLQLDFMAARLDYSLIYGYWKRFSYSLIRSSESNQESPAPDAAAEMAAFLEQKNFTGLVHYMEEKKKLIISRMSADIPYSSHEIYLFMETLMYTLKLFFQNRSYNSPLDGQTLPGLLRDCQDIQVFFHFLETCVAEYEALSHSGTSSRRQQLMDMMLLHIEQNLPTVTLGSLAERFHLTGAYVSRAFKSYTGENFSDFVAAQKLRRAAQMLAQDISIRDISAQLGYSSPAYFLAKFKEKFGMTPSAYRRRRLVLELSGDAGSGAGQTEGQPDGQTGVTPVHSDTAEFPYEPPRQGDPDSFLC